MDQQVSDADIKQARLLHSILLFDFVVVHIFVFLGALTLIKISILPMALVPILSISLLSYVLWRAKRTDVSWFVRCHQMLAAKRARVFLLLFAITGGFTTLMLTAGVSLGLTPIAAKAIAVGLGQLPFMVTVLSLVVLEYDAEHQAKDGKVPKAAVALIPQPLGI